MKIRAILVAAAALGFIACGTPYRASDTAVVVAPATVQTSFTTQYPTASNVVWTHYDAAVVPIDWELAGWTTVDNGDYLVRFDMGGENYYAWYNDAGAWIGSANVVKDVSTIPEPVSKAVADKFAGYTISSVNREFQKDRMLYEVELKSADSKMKVLVDGNGTIVKQKTKTL